MTEENPSSLPSVSHDSKIPRITVQFDKRPGGISYVVTVFAADSPSEAMQLLQDTVTRIEQKYGNPTKTKEKI